MDRKYTLASLAWRKRQRNHRLLFGTPDRLIRLNWQVRLAAFKSGKIFGYERWRANTYGTIEWQIFVVQAPINGRPISRIPGIYPGATLLTSCHGKPNAKRMLAIFDELGERSDMSALSAHYWLKFGALFEQGFNPQNLLSKDASYV